MGGGRTTSPNQGDKRNQIHLQKHSFWIWHPLGIRIRQKNVICRTECQGLIGVIEDRVL